MNKGLLILSIIATIGLCSCALLNGDYGFACLIFVTSNLLLVDYVFAWLRLKVTFHLLPPHMAYHSNPVVRIPILLILRVMKDPRNTRCINNKTWNDEEIKRQWYHERACVFAKMIVRGWREWSQKPGTLYPFFEISKRLYASRTLLIHGGYDNYILLQTQTLKVWMACNIETDNDIEMPVSVEDEDIVQQIDARLFYSYMPQSFKNSVDLLEDRV